MNQPVSIVEGGLLFELMRRTHLSRLGGKGQFGPLLGLAVWLPMVLLAALEGLAVGERVRVPLLLDPVPYARYLVAIPLLFIAEPVFDRAWTQMVLYCERTGLVAPQQQPRLAQAVAEVVAGRNNWVAESGCFVLALSLSFVDVLSNISYQYRFAHWLVPLPEAGGLSLAGWWHTAIAEPVFLFLLYRWLWRIFLWARFLWRLSRLQLQLEALHPDRRGGLGFLTVVPLAAALVVVARAIPLSGAFCARIIYAGARIEEFRDPFLIFLFLVLAIFLGPLLVFFPALARLRRAGLLEYGAFATEYTRAFHSKWLTAARPAQEPLLGNADIQSLADLGNSFEYVQQLQPVLWTRQVVLLLIAAAVVPMLPVFALVYPLKEILQTVWNLLS